MSALFFNILIMIFIPSVALCTFGFFSNKISTTTQKKKKKTTTTTTTTTVTLFNFQKN